MKVSAIERAHAALREEVHHQWRDWVRYLRAHQALMKGRAAERQLVLERNPDLEAQVAGAQRTLAVLPPARRALFDEVREARRQQTQATREAEQRDGQLVDPDHIEAEVLQTLLDEALGTNPYVLTYPWTDRSRKPVANQRAVERLTNGHHPYQAADLRDGAPHDRSAARAAPLQPSPAAGHPG